MKYIVEKTDVFDRWFSRLKDKQAVSMTIKTSEFNPFDYMETQEEIQEFLIECMNDEDPNTFVTALGQLAKKQGMTTVAQATGLSRESLYKTFNGRTQPKWNTIVKVVSALGLHMSIAA